MICVCMCVGRRWGDVSDKDSRRFGAGGDCRGENFVCVCVCEGQRSLPLTHHYYKVRSMSILPPIRSPSSPPLPTGVKRHAMPAEPQCLFDELFTESTATEAITSLYESTRDYCLRNYGEYLQVQDFERLDDLDARGGLIMRLTFVLMMMGIDATLYKQADVTSTQDPETKRKLVAFERVLESTVRSMFVARFDETNSKPIVFTAAQHCFEAWRGFDAAGMERLCDVYMARNATYE